MSVFQSERTTFEFCPPLGLYQHYEIQEHVVQLVQVQIIMMSLKAILLFSFDALSVLRRHNAECIFPLAFKRECTAFLK